MYAADGTRPPALGDVVIYKSKIDNGPGNDVYSPAIVVRNRLTTVAEVIDRWGPEPTALTSSVDGSTVIPAARPDGVVDALPNDLTVDLAVFGLGKTYREYGVAHGRRKGEWVWASEIRSLIDPAAGPYLARARTREANAADKGAPESEDTYLIARVASIMQDMEGEHRADIAITILRELGIR